MSKTVNTRIRVIRENTTITDCDFSGWLAVNTGAVDVRVNKVTLRQYDRLDFLTCIPSDYKWDSSIQIVVPVGGEVVLTQLLFEK